MSTSTVVSIGRNVGDQPLSTAEWTRFKSQALEEVRFAAALKGGQVVFHGEGQGQWAGEDGVTVFEGSFTVVAAGPVDTDLLAETLAVLAWEFGQEAIAVTTGETALVSAAAPAVASA